MSVPKDAEEARRDEFPHDPSGAARQEVRAARRLIAILQINAWIQRGRSHHGQDNLLPLRREAGVVPLGAGGGTRPVFVDYDLVSVALNGEVLTDDGLVLPDPLTDAEIQEALLFCHQTMAVRHLPSGRFMYAMPLAFGRARIGVSEYPPIARLPVFREVY